MRRLDFLDYAKALSIFAVVLIHAGFVQVETIVLFAMPVFFATTGYVYARGRKPLSERAASRFRTVLVPFWKYMAIYAVLEILRAYLFEYGSWDVLLPVLANMVYGSAVIPFDGEMTTVLRDIMSYKAQPELGVDVLLPLSCHLWFLPAMFTGYVMFALIVEKGPAGLAPRAGIIVALLLLASLEVVVPQLCQLPYGLGRGFFGAACMLAGYLLKEHDAFGEGGAQRGTLFYAVSCVSALVVFAIALSLGSTGAALVRSVYGPYGLWSVFVTFAGGMAGAWLVFCLCRGLEKMPFGRLKRSLAFTGRNVMTVYALHMAVLFVFDAALLVAVGGVEYLAMDAYMMALLPEFYWPYMILEAVGAVALCLLWVQLRSSGWPFTNLPERPRSSSDR